MTETGMNYQRTEMQKEQILLKLKEQGYRITRQRKVLLETILQGECSSCKEIYINAKKEDKKLGMATVYRMLRLLEEIGAISRVSSFQLSFYSDGGTESSIFSQGEKQTSCIIELDDHTIYRFCMQDWVKVITNGLRACGYLKQQKVVRIQYIPWAEMHF